MSKTRITKALLDRECIENEEELANDSLIKSILFSDEFFERHSPYLSKRKLTDDEVLTQRVELRKRKVYLGQNYIRELLELNGDEFVRGAYRLFLDREPDVEGFQFYRHTLSQAGKGSVMRAIVYSEEASQRVRNVIVLNEAYALIDKTE